MDIGVEISLYPLKADFVPVIHEFLERVNRAGQLRIVTNSMSTQIFGPFDALMPLLCAARSSGGPLDETANYQIPGTLAANHSDFRGVGDR